MSFSALEAKGPIPGAIFQATEPLAGPLDFSHAYDEYFDFVWRNLRRLGVQESATDDALQDVFIVVHRRWQDFRVSQGSFRSWLFGILFRVAKDYRRTLARKYQATRRGNDCVDPDSVACESKSPHDRAEWTEQMQVLHALLGELDDKKRTLLVMAELEQMTAPEIANALAIPLNTVYSRLRTARLAFELVLTRYRDAKAAQ